MKRKYCMGCSSHCPEYGLRCGRGRATATIEQVNKAREEEKKKEQEKK